MRRSHRSLPTCLLLASVLGLGVPGAAETEPEKKPIEELTCGEQWKAACPASKGPRQRRGCLNRQRAEFTSECLAQYSQAADAGIKQIRNVHRYCKEDKERLCPEERGKAKIFACLEGKADALQGECRDAFDTYHEIEASFD